MNKKYVEMTDIHTALKKSIVENKIAVMGDSCGTGKSTAALDFMSRYYGHGIVYVAQKINTLEDIKATLIRNKPTMEPMIGIYHSDLKTSDPIDSVYNREGTKPLVLITHKRLMTDPAHYWLTTSASKSYTYVGPKQWIIIDEKPDLYFHQSINLTHLKSMLEKAVKSEPLLEEMYQAIIEAEQHGVIYDIYEVSRLLNNAKLNLSVFITKHFDTKLKSIPIFKEYHESPELTSVEAIYKEFGLKFEKRTSKETTTYNRNKRFSQNAIALQDICQQAKLLYNLSLVMESILLGNYKKVGDDTIYICGITPLIDLTDRRTGTVILDGSAKYSFDTNYSKKWAFLYLSETLPPASTINTQVIPVGVSKADIIFKNNCSNTAESYDRCLTSLIAVGETYAGTKYFVSYKDKSLEYEFEVNSKKKRDENVVSEQTITTKVEIEASSNYVGKDADFQSLVIKKLEAMGKRVLKLNVNTLYDLEQGFLDVNEYDWIVGYHNLTLGTNGLKSISTIVIQGPFYFDDEYYKNHILSDLIIDKNATAGEFAHQEIYRTRLRDGNPINIIVADQFTGYEEDGSYIESDWWKQIKYQLEAEGNTVVNIPLAQDIPVDPRSHKKIFRTGDEAMLNSFRYKKQKEIFTAIIRMKPELVKDYDSIEEVPTVEISISELANAVNMRNSELINSLKSILDTSSPWWSSELVISNNRYTPSMLKIQRKFFKNSLLED